MSDSETDNEQTSDLAKKEKRWTIEDGLQHNASKIEAALHASIPQDQFMRTCATVWQNGGSKMHKANFGSFIMACVEAAQLGLSPDKVLGECHLIPRWNNRAGCVMVDFQIGYRGAMKLARRGGEVIDIQPEIIYENDEFRPLLGTARGLHHIPWYGLGHEDGGKIIGAYCTAGLRNGVTSFRVVTKAEIDKAASLSGKQGEDKPSNVWIDWYEPMALKTAVIRLCKFLPIPDDAKRALIREEYRDHGVPEYTISQVSETDAAIANMRQDPKELERKAGEKATRDAFLEKQKTLGAKMKLIKESDAGEDFFESARCNRDTETIRAFIIYAAALDEYPTHIDAEIQATEDALRYLIRWANAEEGEVTHMHVNFDLLINGKPEETPEDRESRQAEDAFEAAQG